MTFSSPVDGAPRMKQRYEHPSFSFRYSDFRAVSSYEEDVDSKCYYGRMC